MFYRYSSSSCEYQQELVPCESACRKTSFNFCVQGDQHLLQLSLILHVATYSLRSDRRGRSSKGSLRDRELKRWITRGLGVTRHLYPFVSNCPERHIFHMFFNDFTPQPTCFPNPYLAGMSLLGLETSLQSAKATFENGALVLWSSRHFF